MSLWSRIANVFRADRVSREIDEELAAHLAEALEAGSSPADVRRAFGSTLRSREASRDLRLLPWLDSLRADAIFGWRRLNQTRVTSLAAILSLALAIGACTSAFRLFDALLLRPLPVANAERLHVVAFQGSNMTDGRTMVWDSCSYPMFSGMRDSLRGEANLIAVSYASRSDITYGSDQEMEKAYTQNVSGTMFTVFGLTPALGRLLSARDDLKPGAHPVAVLSYDYWTTRFARDPRVLGRTLRMADDLYEVIGVAPEGFTGTETGTMTDLFLPMMMRTAQSLASPNNFWLRTLVELKPGVNRERVQQQMRAFFHTFEQERAKGFSAAIRSRFFEDNLILESAAGGRSNLQRDYRQSLAALAVLVALVLLIAGANVANLMTARATARTREMALRVSIGAGRRRLVQLVLIESAWIAGLATLIGAVLAWWSAPLIIGMVNSADNPARLLLPADGRVLIFAVALTLGVTFLFGLPPALRASGVKPSSALKGGEDPHSRRRLMHALIAAQVAFCFVVIFVAGLFIRSFDRLSHQPLGFSPERIVNLETVARTAQPASYWLQVAAHLKAIPGIDSASISGWPIVSGETSVAVVLINGVPPPREIFADHLRISPEWLSTLKIPLLDGRDFHPEEANPDVAIVNQAFAKQYFENTNPVGKSFVVENADATRTRIQVVGYVGDARYRDNMRVPIRPTFYSPLTQSRRATFVVRTASADPLALSAILRGEVPRSRPEFRVSNIRTQNEIVESKTVRERLLALLAMFFASVALLLAGVGLYGVLDYSVLQQRREIGIRIAIGARTFHIAQQVTVTVFAMVALGAVVGLALGMAAARYVESLFYQAKATDFSILALPLLTIVALALLAAVPAVLRALRVDPIKMLRAE